MDWAYEGWEQVAAGSEPDSLKGASGSYQSVVLPDGTALTEQMRVTVKG